MKAYLRWSLRQLYLLFFWPTQFERENEELPVRERIGYMMKMSLWIVFLAFLSNLTAGRICEVFGVTFDWGDAWVGVAVGVAFGVVGGVVGGVAVGVAYPLTFCLTYFRLVVYPLDLTLSCGAYLLTRMWPRAAKRAWRWCPVAWNEVIWLPLPWVNKLLERLTQQDREEGFRQIAFVAAQRPLQRRTALRALVAVAVNDLEVRTVPEIADVTDALNWTTDAPAELPDELIAALPRFDRAAGHLGQYLTLNSAYRTGEALSSALKEVDGLQRSLITGRGKAAPRLLRVANAWRELLEAEQGTFRAKVEVKREIPNPFVFGNPVTETEHNVFTGRRDIVRQVEESVLGARQAPTLLLHGPRRMGKTSILNQLPRLLGPDFAPAVLDCQNAAVRGSAATLLGYFSRALSDGLRRRHVTLEPLVATDLASEPFAVFDQWLDAVEKEMPKEMHALLCLDEYERLGATLDAGWGADFLDTLRHTLQHRPQIVTLFTGAHTFSELGPAWTDRFISARQVRVGFLTCEEIELLLTKPIPEFDMTYAPEALDEIFNGTNGQPFLTQAVAFELVQLLNEDERREATVDDVETAIARALVSGDAYFNNVWDDAREEGQAILVALIKGQNLPDSPKAHTWLREHDVLNDAGSFAVPMMEQWVEGNV